MLLKVILVSAAFVGCMILSAEAALGGSGSLNEYFLYTRAYEDGRQSIPFNMTTDSIKAAGFNGTHPTTIIVHGHDGSSTTSLNPTVKNALLSSEEVNVIVVDWAQYSTQAYENAVKAVPSIGTYLGELINNLVTAEVATLDKIHLVGFDLGAHVVGYAGRTVNGKVARITGLDPAGKSWGANTPRLNKEDAKYVEIIHTDTFGLFPNGIGTPLGHADFYPNGGGSQPGCLLQRPCCHSRSWDYFAASLLYDHLQANQCTTLTQMNFNLCKGVLEPMGKNVMSKLATGIYRLNTKGIYPYLLSWI